MRDICKCDRCGAIIYLDDNYVVSMQDEKLIPGPIRRWDLCEKCAAQVLDIITHPNYEAVEIIDPFESRKEQ